MKKDKKVFVEYDREYASSEKPWSVISSKIRKATKKEIEDALKIYNETGKCDHSLVYDTGGWMYDFRNCYICGISLGTV